MPLSASSTGRRSSDGVGVASGPRAFRKPLAKDSDKTLMATKPWDAEGMSRRTWYRRRAEARKVAQENQK